MIKNSKAFALVETLIVTVFVMTIFTFIFTSFYPLIGKYEVAEDYDNLDALYIAHYYRKHIQLYSKPAIFTLNDLNNTCKIIYKKSDNDSINLNRCSNYFKSVEESNNPTTISFCENYPNDTNINAVYLVANNIESFKNEINISERGLKEYVSSLPKTTSTNNYRLIVQVVKNSNDEYEYATVEVKR